MNRQSILSSPIMRLFRIILELYRWRLLLVGVLIIISTLCTLSMTLFTKVLIDDYILPMVQSGSQDFSPLARAILILSLILIMGSAMGYLWNVIMIYIGQGVMKNLRDRLFEHLQSLPLGYYDSHSHGDIMSVFTNDVDSLRQIISRTIPQFFNAVVTLATTFLSMLYLSIPLTIVTILMTLLMMRVTMSMAKLSGSYFKARQQNLATVNGFIEEMVSGQRVIKVLTHEKKAIEGFEVLNEQLRSSVYEANKMANIIMPVNFNMTNLGYVMIAVTGGLLAILYPGTLVSIGTLVSFLTLHKNFQRPITMISQEANNIAMASAGAGRVFNLQDETSEVDEGTVELVKVSEDRQDGLSSGSWAWKKGETLIPLRGEVSFRDVNFSYVEGKQVLSGISLTAYAGQKIAFVGGTGAGKTTITNLINRFYDISDGEITYDGINVRDIKKESLRRSLGIVLQDTHLFSGSIMDNIRYGNLEADDDTCREAARLALADGFIRRLPQGYATEISAEGDNLSQGERQLLSIARTAACDPPVLILDEATSSIDTRSEKLVQKGMDRIMKGRTTFVIAHRLSTILNADYIIVLEKGRIIEAGKHHELLERRGKYYELFSGGEVTK